MRILFLDQHFATPRQATSTFPFVMTRELVRRGHAVEVLTTDQSGRRGSWYVTEEEGLRIHWCPVPYSNRMGYGRRLIAFGRFCAKAASYGRKFAAFDVVYACSTPLTIALPGVSLARRFRAPMIFEVRDLWPEVPIALGALTTPWSIWAARALERFAYRNASYVVSRSPMMADGVAATGFPRERIRVVPNACDFARFDVPESWGRDFRAQYDWLEDRPLVLYAGTFGLVNDCRYIVRLAHAVRPLLPEARFLLVGAGREQELVERAARELGVLNETLFLRPPVPKEEVPRLFSAADVVMSTVRDVPALHANCANKFFDALAAGRAVAINHEGWLADLIRDHDCGLVLPAAEIPAAARQMAAALRDRDSLRHAGQRARRLGKTRFDALRCTDVVEEVLHAALGGPSWTRKAAA